ncbi:Noranthrone synthase [Ascochyta lentis]
MQVFLFGDQTYSIVDDLRHLLSCRNKPILQAFLEQAHYVIKAQMNLALPKAQRKASRTSNLPHLLQKYADGELSPAFQVALHCLTQLGCFISHFEEPGQPYPTSDNSQIISLCTGAIAAAAISSSSSLSELLPAAVHSVQVAMRLGLCLIETRDRIELPERGTSQEWSVAFYGLDENAAVNAINDFFEREGLPESSRPWISATVGTATTISASPSVLTKMLNADSPLSQHKHRRIPIFVPSHSSRIFTPDHKDQILETTSFTNWMGFTSKVPVVSGATGSTAWAGGFVSLLDRAISECLLEPIRWDKVLKAFPETVRAEGTEFVTIIPIASNLGQNLARTLQEITAVTVKPINNPLSETKQATPIARSKLAIVGTSGRFPEAPNLESFWDLLYQGLDVCKETPIRRWDNATHVDPTGKAHNKGATPWGCWLDYCGDFDPRFFGISPKEAPQMDPAQRMALMSTFEAMESGGIVPDSTASTQRDRVGVFHGVTSNDWMDINSSQDVDTYFITGGNRGFIPGRINFCFEFCGPSYATDTACSSSLAAIHLACNALWRGDCDTAVAGGTNVIFSPDGHTGLDKEFFLSRTGNCKAFADNADGYCRAEAAGTIFIKRLDDALADKDPILATILDIKTNHSAMSDSITRPHVGAQIQNMNAVLGDANILPQQLSYVEMHGTGTQVGDAVEMESVLSVFARDENFRGPENPLYVGSAKANIGHGEGASGITSLIKVLLMMKHNTIPPHCGIKPGQKINHNFPDLSARNVHIAFSPAAWKRGEEPRRALINNFSAAGGNTAILMEDAPIRAVSSAEDPRSHHTVTVSGHVVNSLKNNLRAMVKYLEDPNVQGSSLPQLSYTTTARRLHHLFRVSVCGSSVADIKAKLEHAIANGEGTTRAKVNPSILFAFTGQGSQYIGMGRQLVQAYPTFKSDLKYMNRLCTTSGLPSFLHTITTADGDIDQFPPVVVQLAITALGMALAKLLKHFGVAPHALVGHSLGIYAALNVAGVLSVSDTLYLVGQRAKLLQERCNRGTHSMLATKATTSQLAEILAGKRYEVACINGPTQVVITGANRNIDAAKAVLLQHGIKSTLLKVPFAFHSEQVDPILPSLEVLARGLEYRKPTIPILCPLTGATITEKGIIGPAYLAKHCREAVNIEAALAYAQKPGLVNDKTLTIEVGPHPVVCDMVKACLGSALPSLNVLRRGGNIWQDLNKLLATVYSNGYDLDWLEYHGPFEASHRVVGDLPAYAWDLKDYFLPYKGDWCLHRHAYDCCCADSNGPISLTGKPAGLTPTGKLTEPNTSATGPKLPKVQPGSSADAESRKFEVISHPSTSTVHRVIEEKIEALGATVITETDVSRPDINSIAQGHTVNNIPLCTPSVYADIGLVLGNYIMKRLRPGRPGMTVVADLVVDKALIPHGLAPQLLRSKVTLEWPAKAAGLVKEARCEFYSVDATGKPTTNHSWCKLQFVDGPNVLKPIQAEVPRYQERIQHLRAGVKRGDFVHYTGRSGYKLMSNVAHFHPDYKLLDNVIFDESTMEACSTVNTAKITSKGDFAAHPAYVDAITQLGGFSLNAQDSTDIDVSVFVNHGWESFQIFEAAQPDKTYDLYTQMKHHKADLYHGDTVVLDGAKVVAFFKGLSLRNVQRKVLRMVLQQNLDKANRLAGKPVTKAPVVSAAPISKTPSKTQDTTVRTPAVEKKLAAPPKPQTATPVIPATPAVSVTPAVPATTPINAATGTVEQTSSKAHEALVIIAEESGIDISEMTDETIFADVGIDSLMSMVIGSRLREEMDLDLDTDFSIFADFPTVKSLKVFLGGAEVTEPVEASEQALLYEKPAASAQEPQVKPAPAAESIFDTPSFSTQDFPPKVQAQVEATVHDVPERLDHSPIVDSALEIISEESGIVISELTDDCVFADIGIDSLMSMVIGSRLREELDLDLDTDFSIFADFPTVKSLKDFLSGSSPGSSSSISDEYDFASPTTTPEFSDGEESLPMIRKNRVEACRAAPSLIIQGKPKTADKTIFMLPDGSGSASSYLTIPRIGDRVCMIGLNSPYLRDPENMDCTHTALIASFCQEIRRRQPYGPYYLGGWSSGGAFAYVCAEALTNMGQKVAGIVIIDAPVPQVMEHLPTSFYEYCNKIGLFGHDEPPPYLIPHFEATVDVMMPYKVKPLKTKQMPKVGILWASDTVMDEKDAPKMKGMHFMVQKRTDFGPDGWDTVLPGAQFILDTVQGGNHFTIMAKENVHQVRDLVAKVME